MVISLEEPPVSRSNFFRIIQALDRSPSVSYILDAQQRFLYCNPAWDKFASSNGAPELTGETVVGFRLFDAIPDALKDFYSHAFETVISAERVWEQSYECSSPDFFRKYRMRIHPMKSRSWFLVTNRLIIERGHQDARKPDHKKYVQDTGLITMCIHCRCANRVDSPAQWDFVPEYLQLQGKDSLILSHGFCAVCQTYYYPELAA